MALSKFFLFDFRYPRLFDFFYLELQSASQSIQKDEVPSTLHPLLILLSRLYPSAVDGCTSNLKLSSFLPLIAQCTHSPELGTRKLAVKSIVALVPQYHVYDYVNNIVIQLLQVILFLPRVDTLNTGSCIFWLFPQEN